MRSSRRTLPVNTWIGMGDLHIGEMLKLIDALDPDMPVIIKHLHSNEEYLDRLAFVRKLCMAYEIQLR